MLKELSNSNLNKKKTSQVNIPISVIRNSYANIKSYRFMKYIPNTIIEYLERLVKNSYLSILQEVVNDEVKEAKKQQVLRKYKHCYEVLEAAFEILEDIEDKSQWNLFQVAISNYLHDIGRFIEINHSGGTNLDHGDLGYEKLKKDLIEDKRIEESLERLNCDSVSILKVISRHNKYSYSGKDKYVYLCRDADKLALLRDDKLQLGFILDSERFKGFIVSEEAKKDFLNAGRIRNVHTNTKADALLRTLSFFKQFYFNQTKKIVKREKLFGKWVGIFRKYVKGISHEIDRKIRDLNVE